MARKLEENSKIGKVKNLKVNEIVSFDDAKYLSLTVQVSNLTKQLLHQEKKFKVSYNNGVTIVKRIS